MQVHELLQQSAERQPDAVAIVETQSTTTYGALEARANKMAHVLRGLGVKRGDRVVLAMENCADLVAAYFGAMKAGAIAVPLPQGSPNDRLARAVDDCQPAAAIVEEPIARDVSLLASVPAVLVQRGRRRARPGESEMPAGRHMIDGLLNDASDTPVDVRTIDQDLAAIIYTSGSTGVPRGVMLRHRNIVANTRSIVSYLELTSADRVMCVLPLFYVYGLSLLHTHISVGGSLVLENRFVYPNVALQVMRDQQATGFAGVPSTFALLLARSNVHDMEFPNLRYVTQAGGGMPPAQILEWLDRGPKVPFFVMYGATEASARLTYLPPSELRRKLGSIGRPIPNTEVVVIKDNGEPAAQGETGELVARGANVACGYWNNPEETRERFSTLGYRTGDLGYVDEDGYLFLVGRRHDMIKVGAHRVGAKEIEDVLHDYPGVHEVAVVASAHEILGEVPVAFVAMRGNTSSNAEELRAFCATRLPAYKIPTRVHFYAELPKSSSAGKIDKVALKAAAASENPAAPGAGQ